MTAAHGAPARARPSLIKQLAIAGVAALIVVTILSYLLHWSWTGFSGNGTVWDWMSLFLLPIAVALVPVVFEASTRAVVTILVALCVLLTVLLIGGYGFNWSWTGFEGNTLWDWLHLLLVPAVIPIAVRGASNATAARAGAGATAGGTTGSGGREEPKTSPSPESPRPSAPFSGRSSTTR